jgi:hypothetical protein
MVAAKWTLQRRQPRDRKGGYLPSIPNEGMSNALGYKLRLEHLRKQIIKMELCPLEFVVTYSRRVSVGTALEACQYVDGLSELLNSRLVEPINVWHRVL